jgi:hypothetical protein
LLKDQDRIETLNTILNELEILGFGKLVQNFSTQCDPEKASDILFEISMCQLLRRNVDVQNLQYEPPGEVHPPDFRFLLHGVGFDLQVKQLHNIKNEITQRRFERECRRHLSRLQKPWLINFSVSDYFEPRHLNPFFAHLKNSLGKFSPVLTFDGFLGNPHYRWEQEGKALVRFSFVEKPNGEPGISPGFIWVMTTEPGLMPPIDTSAFRKGIHRLLKKSRTSLIRPVSSGQANLLVMQTVPRILFAEQTMPDTLYGNPVLRQWETGRTESFRAPNGLFHPGKFSNICGLVLVPPQVWCFSQHFEGTYFPHPSHLQNIQSHPKPFEEITFTILPEWRG